MGKRIAFGWYGGKYSHLDWLLPLLPHTQHYCEPFGGSAATLINREPSPLETYNDIDGELVNFFRVLREQKDALVEAIGLTPFSREEFVLAISGPTGEASMRQYINYGSTPESMRNGRNYNFLILRTCSIQKEGKFSVISIQSVVATIGTSKMLLMRIMSLRQYARHAIFHLHPTSKASSHS